MTGWMPAYEARLLLTPALSDFGAAKILCERARDGLVETLARTLIIDRQPEPLRVTDEPLPAGFWWAGNAAALEQRWPTGDFSTWVKELGGVAAARPDNSLKMQWRAYDVQFSRSGVEAIGRHLDGYQTALRALETIAAGDQASPPTRRAQSNAGARPDVDRWSQFAAAMVAVNEEQTFKPDESEAKIHDRIAQYLEARGHTPLGIDTVRSAIRRAKAYANGLPFNDDRCDD